MGVLEYTVTIQSEDGSVVHLTADDDNRVYDYYKTGDRVRHHKGLNSFEKYDKTNIKDDLCFRCKCPLLNSS